MLLLLAAAALFPGCQAARTVDENVKVDRVGGYVEVTGRYRSRDQNSKTDTGDIKNREYLLRPAVKVETEGYVYHPYLLEYSLGALLGWLGGYYYEDTAKGTTRSKDGDIVYELDFSGRILQKKDYPGFVYARRYERLEPRPFLPSLQVTTNSYGADWRYIDRTMPTMVRFDHTDTTLDPLRGEEEEGRKVYTTARFDTSYKFDSANVLSFLYEHRREKEDPYDLDYNSDELTLAHRWDIGGGDSHRLESELNYFDQRGTFDVERSRWREILWLYHTDRLRSWYQFELQKRDQEQLAGVPPIKETSYYLAGNVEHELYESLVSQLTAYVQRQDFDSGFEIDRWGLRGNFDYRKTNPWGMLFASYAPGYQMEKRDGNDQFVSAINQRYVFQDPFPIVIVNPNIDPASVVITDLTGRTFQEGRDYVIDAYEDRIEIRRVPTGEIPDGTPVLIDYVYRLAGDFDLTTITHYFQIRQAFGFGLAPYWRYRYQDQDLSPKGSVGAIAEDIRDNVVGMEYLRYSWRLFAEYEDYYSNITPFEAVRLGADYTRRFSTGASGSLKGRWAKITRDEPDDRDTTLYTIEGRYWHPLTTDLSVEGVALWRDQDDTLSGRDQGLDLELAIEWIVRQTEMRLFAEYGHYDDEFARTDSVAVFLQIRRRF